MGGNASWTRSCARTEVLRLRKAPLSPLVSTGLPDDLTSLEPVAAQLKDAIRTDRDLMDKVRRWRGPRRCWRGNGPGSNAARHERRPGPDGVLPKSLRAFVSFVRSYKEHVCHFIFRLRDLNYERLARAFGLFRVRAAVRQTTTAAGQPGAHAGRSGSGWADRAGFALASAHTHSCLACLNCETCM